MYIILSRLRSYSNFLFSSQKQWFGFEMVNIRSFSKLFHDFIFVAYTCKQLLSKGNSVVLVCSFFQRMMFESTNVWILINYGKTFFPCSVIHLSLVRKNGLFGSFTSLCKNCRLTLIDCCFSKVGRWQRLIYKPPL